jgi:predicted nucleic acid-binding protein
VNPHRLQCLLATVPDTISPTQQGRLDAHVEAIEECRARVREVKQALRTALDGGDGSALDLACELDALERVQERLNRWLTELVEELNRAPLEVSYGDGVPA